MTRRRRSSRELFLVVTTPLAAAFVGLSTNAFTSFLPDNWGWAKDWRITGPAMVLFVVMASVQAVALHRRRHDDVVSAVVPVTEEPLRGIVRVPVARAEDQARLLGVRQAIDIPTDGRSPLPPYVRRDIDTALCEAVRTAAGRGGFVLVQGDPLVGKTRTLLQAVCATLPDWELVRPADIGALEALAVQPLEQCVIWLDQLEHTLDGDGLPVHVMQSLIAARWLVVGTISDYSARVAPPRTGTPDPYDSDRRLLGLADVFDLRETLSSLERRRAKALAADPRIQTALATGVNDFTQTLGGGPELIRRWQYAPAEYCGGKAVLTAALDATRVGARNPLPESFLKAAAPAYLTGAQAARANKRSWFRDGKAYATAPVLPGISAALQPVGSAMGTIDGYLPAPYLNHHARQARRTEPLPDPVWHALTRHHHAHDTFRLADGAALRGRLDFAEQLFRQLADASDRIAAARLIDLLARQGRIDEAIAVAVPHAGYPTGALRLADLYAQQNNPGAAVLVLRPHAHELRPAIRLAALLKQGGALDEAIDVLGPHATHPAAGPQLVELLAEQGRRRDVVAVLGQHATDAATAIAVAGFLEAQDWHDEAIALLLPYCDHDDGAAVRAAELLIAVRRDADAEAILRRHSDRGSAYAATRLAAHLVSQQRPDEAITMLKPHAERDELAAGQLAELLADLGHTDRAIDLLRRRADQDEYLAVHLAELLLKCGRTDEAIGLLHRHALDGRTHAAWTLAIILDQLERPDDAIAVLEPQHQDKNCMDLLADLLAKHGRVEEAIAVLAPHAEAGDQHAAARQAEILAENDLVDQAVSALSQHSTADDGYASARLATILIVCGRIEQAIIILRSRADTGDWTAATQLVDLLTQEGRIEDLQLEVAAGTPGAFERWTALTAPPSPLHATGN